MEDSTISELFRASIRSSREESGFVGTSRPHSMAAARIRLKTWPACREAKRPANW